MDVCYSKLSNALTKLTGKSEDMPYFVTKTEQESIIGFGRLDDMMDIWTSDSTVIARCDKLVNAPGSAWQLVSVDYVGESVVAKKYIAPVGCLSLRKAEVKRTLTDEQRQAAAERLSKARMKLKEGEGYDD